MLTTKKKYPHSKDEALLEASRLKAQGREEKRLRVLKFAKDNPELPVKAIAKMFGVGTAAVTKWLKGEK